jgi:LmbE family N-acetylglucosaminyl deacetylase
MKKTASGRRRVRPVLATVVQPVARRLARVEALLIEVRHEQDVKLKKIAALQSQLDTLNEYVRARI